MYLSKHQGGNAVSTADNLDTGEAKHWKRDVLEAYLGVTLKRLFSTGPDAFQDIRQRLEQLWQSLEPWKRRPVRPMMRGESAEQQKRMGRLRPR